MRSMQTTQKHQQNQMNYASLDEEEKLALLIKNEAELAKKAELEDEITELFNQLPNDLKGDGQDEQWEFRKKNRKRNRQFAPHLERVKVKHTLSEEEKAGATGTFFTKVKEELEFIPASMRVIEHWQENAVFEQENGSDKIVAATRPQHPLGKCFATTSLLAQIIVAKYADGLPLYRQEKILQRYGADINRANMANWMIKLLEPMTPLLTLMADTQKQHNYLQADETRLQVLKETGKKATSDKWMWVIRGGPPDKESVMFHYDPSRAGAVASRLLKGFSGTLQADGYSGYGVLCKDNPDIKRIGCLDHARRKFVDATRAADTKKKKSKPP